MVSTPLGKGYMGNSNLLVEAFLQESMRDVYHSFYTRR
jgi:hypothetical protein